jgi:hypothetical protein
VWSYQSPARPVWSFNWVQLPGSYPNISHDAVSGLTAALWQHQLYHKGAHCHCWVTKQSIIWPMAHKKHISSIPACIYRHLKYSLVHLAWTWPRQTAIALCWRVKGKVMVRHDVVAPPVGRKGLGSFNGVLYHPQSIWKGIKGQRQLEQWQTDCCPCVMQNCSSETPPKMIS